MGLFALLDEESKFPKATDNSLVNKFHDHYKTSNRYIRPRGNDIAFGINHYAGKVISVNYVKLRNQDLIKFCFNKNRLFMMQEAFWKKIETT